MDKSWSSADRKAARKSRWLAQQKVRKEKQSLSQDEIDARSIELDQIIEERNRGKSQQQLKDEFDERWDRFKPDTYFLHQPKTNGPNDIGSPIPDEEFDPVFSEYHKSRSKESERTMARFYFTELSRNELSVEAEESWRKRNKDALESYASCEPLYTSRVYETLKKWISEQDSIFGCQYEFSDLSLLEILCKNVKNIHLMVDARDYLKFPQDNEQDSEKQRRRKKNMRNKARDVGYWYERIIKVAWVTKARSHVYVIDFDGNYSSMHQKWLLGARYIDPARRGEDPFREWGQDGFIHDDVIYSLIFGSYNGTETAKSNFESVLYFPRISEHFAADIMSDFRCIRLKNFTFHWFKWIDKYSINHLEDRE